MISDLYDEPEEGYRRLGTWALALFMVIVIGSSFITLAAVTVVTAGLLGALLGLNLSLAALSAIVLAVCLGILLVGRYALLDGVMKIMVVLLGVLTLVAVAVAAEHGPAGDPHHVAPEVWTATGLTFLLALMGWMPAPLDVAVWPSLWILEKHRDCARPTMGQAMLDFHLGYGATVVLALAFVSFGALVMFGTGQTFSPSGLVFSRQLVDMYSTTLGQWSRWIISLIAFITMFSTTLTVLDGYTRTLAAGLGLLAGWSPSLRQRLVPALQPILSMLAIGIIAYMMSSMKTLVDVATVLAFLAAPLIAVLNLRVVLSPVVPADQRPGLALRLFSWAGIVYLMSFAMAWVVVRLVN